MQVECHVLMRHVQLILRCGPLYSSVHMMVFNYNSQMKCRIVCLVSAVINFTARKASYALK
jgi:hypothetical protein